MIALKIILALSRWLNWPPNTSWGMGPNIFSGGYTPTTLAPENMQTPKIERSSEHHFSGANRYTPWNLQFGPAIPTIYFEVRVVSFKEGSNKNP